MARDEIYLLDIWKMDDFIDCLSDFCILTLAAGFTGYLYAQTVCVLGDRCMVIPAILHLQSSTQHSLT